MSQNQGAQTAVRRPSLQVVQTDGVIIMAITIIYQAFQHDRERKNFAVFSVVNGVRETLYIYPIITLLS